MKRGEVTRQRIIEKAAELFNSKGFAGASLSELMAATGLNKGGIYNHFKNKDEILAEAFNYSVSRVEGKLAALIKDEDTALGQLNKVVEFFREYPYNPVVKGGCPILNSIVYADNTHPVFEKQVKLVVERLIGTLEMFISNAVKEGRLRKNLDAKREAVLIFSMIEGGVAISRNSGNTEYMGIVIDHVKKYISEDMAG